MALLKSVQEYQDIVEKGKDALMAEYTVGMAYLIGLDYKKDDHIAMKYFESAANQGLPEAQYVIGLLCKDEERLNFFELRSEGDRPRPDRNEFFDAERAIKMFELAAEKKYAPAQYILGHMYFWGLLGVKPDVEIAKEWFTKAAKRRLSEAQNMLGILHYYGFGFEQSYENGMHWFQKATKKKCYEVHYKFSKPGEYEFCCAYSLWNLSQMYIRGEGSYKNNNYARQRLDASKELCQYLDDGCLEIPESLWAKHGLEKAKDTDGNDIEYPNLFDDSDALFLERHNAYWCLKNPKIVKGVCHFLGQAYNGGGWFSESTTHSKMWFERGANQGDYLSQVIASVLFLKSKSKPKIKKALKWIGKAKEDGFDGAAELYDVLLAHENTL